MTLTHSQIHKTDDVLHLVEGKDVVVEDRKNRVILTDAHSGDVLALPKTTHLSKSQAYQALVFLGKLLVVGGLVLIVRAIYITSTCPIEFDAICQRVWG
jgi:hypothetical protein